MTDLTGDWAVQQIAEYLAAVTACRDEASTTRAGVEQSAEAFEAEIGILVRERNIVASVGFPKGTVPVDLVPKTLVDPTSRVMIEGLGPCFAAGADVDDGLATRLLVARSGPEDFSRVEISLLHSMGRVLATTLRMQRTLDEERRLRSSLVERQQLLEKLARIQRSISHRAPLQEVLDAITSGCLELLGDEVVGLRLIDPDDPKQMILVSATGVSSEIIDAVHRTPLGQGAGGRAIAEDRLYVIEDYDSSPEAVTAFAAQRLQSAMAAPVHEDGLVVGSLVVASYTPGRRYSESEKEMLLALAEHASLALTDAKTLESMREAHRAKDLFLAMVSHELKTPLTVIMGTLQTLRAHLTVLPEALRDDLLDSAFLRGKDLQRLIDMLLRGARAELAGERDVIDLRRAIAGAIEGFDVARAIEVGPIPNVRVLLDVVAFRQILGLLIENGISHSEEGSAIGVEASAEQGAVRISVSNAGSLPEGLSHDELFQPFQRGEDARSSGVGLGLYVASKLAGSLDGQLRAASAEGRVTFTLELPLPSVPPAERDRARTLDINES